MNGRLYSGSSIGSINEESEIAHFLPPFWWFVRKTEKKIFPRLDSRRQANISREEERPILVTVITSLSCAKRFTPAGYFSSVNISRKLRSGNILFGCPVIFASVLPDIFGIFFSNATDNNARFASVS